MIWDVPIVAIFYLTLLKGRRKVAGMGFGILLILMWGRVWRILFVERNKQKTQPTLDKTIEYFLAPGYEKSRAEVEFR